MDDIRGWLTSSKDYTAGVKLYFKYGSDPLLIRLFTAEHISEFKQQKLKKALKTLLSGQNSPIVVKAEELHKNVSNEPKIDKKGSETVMISPKSEKPAPDVSKSRSKWSQNMDEVEKTLFENWKPLHSEMLFLQTQVGDLAREGIKNDQKKIEAGKIALRILQLDKLCDEIYQKRNYYLEHKSLPDPEQPVKLSLDPLQWPIKLSNAERYCREYSIQLAADPTNTKAAAHLKKWQWAVKQYKKLLNIDHE